MRFRCRALFAALLFHAASVAASMDPPATMLRAYGPGGPHHALQEIADLYKERHGVTVGVFKANPTELAKNLREQGDIYFAGAEYMLEEFEREHSGVLDLATAMELSPRRIGILVREGNPLAIEGIDCLSGKEVDLLAVHLEDMEPLFTPPGGGRVNISKRVYTGQEGVKAWRSGAGLDAWVTYKSWHVELEEESDFIEIPCDHALRHTMVALTRRTPHREEALRFLDFLKSPDARRIFLEHGWE